MTRPGRLGLAFVAALAALVFVYTLQSLTGIRHRRSKKLFEDDSKHADIDTSYPEAHQYTTNEEAYLGDQWPPTEDQKYRDAEQGTLWSIGSNSPTTSSSNPVSKQDKIVVVGKLTSQSVDWIVKELPDWQHAIYTVDDPTSKLHTITNKGREALPYLTYLVDNYHNLPSTIAFVHAHKDGFPDAWHNDNRIYSNVLSLQALQIPFVQTNGYVNMRCNPAIGCPAEVTLNRSEIDWGRSIEVNMPGVWSELFGTKHPDIIATPCCAQFAVSRDQVHRRPLVDYEKYLKWLLETKLDDELSGRMLEYLWHIIFGKEPVYCPDIMICYCEVYGWCDIDELPAPGTGHKFEAK